MIESQEHSEVQIGSNRSFGIVFSVIFTLIGLYPLIGGSSPRIWALVVGGAFLLIAFILPNILTSLNKVWFKFGMVLARIINPIVMFIIYLIAFIPVGLLLRLFGKDVLGLKLERDAESYWIVREPPGPKPDSLKEQF